MSLIITTPLCTLIIDIAHARGRRGSSRDSCLSNTCILMMWERHNSQRECKKTTAPSHSGVPGIKSQKDASARTTLCIVRVMVYGSLQDCADT